MFDKPKIGQELLDVPMGEMIKSMAFAIAEAQMRLDENSIDVAQMMGGLRSITNEETGEVMFQDSRVFFGKEKLYLNQAIELYNNSSDPNYKKEISTNGGDFFETESSHILNSKPSDDTATYDKVYKDSEKYYKLEGFEGEPATPIYREVSAASIERIKLKTATNPNQFILVPSRISMLELGFSPTFYQFVDTIIEVKISIKYTQSGHQATSSSNGEKAKLKSKNPVWQRFARGKSKNKTITTSQVNASYSQRFSYSAEGSSLLRTKLVPIPPPAILEERIRQQMALMNEGSLTVAPTED